MFVIMKHTMCVWYNETYYISRIMNDDNNNTHSPAPRPWVVRLQQRNLDFILLLMLLLIFMMVMIMIFITCQGISFSYANLPPTTRNGSLFFSPLWWSAEKGLWRTRRRKRPQKWMLSRMKEVGWREIEMTPNLRAFSVFLILRCAILSL